MKKNNKRERENRNTSLVSSPCLSLCVFLSRPFYTSFHFFFHISFICERVALLVSALKSSNLTTRTTASTCAVWTNRTLCLMFRLLSSLLFFFPALLSVVVFLSFV